MSCSPNSLEGWYMREIIWGSIIWIVKGDTRSLDYSSCGECEGVTK